MRMNARRTTKVVRTTTEEGGAAGAALHARQSITARRSTRRRVVARAGAAGGSITVCCRPTPPVIPALAIQTGHIGWFALALLLPGGLLQAAPDIILLTVLSVWLGWRVSRIAAVVLIVLHLASAAYNAWTLSHVSLMDDAGKALVCHILWRLLAIAALGWFPAAPLRRRPRWPRSSPEGRGLLDDRHSSGCRGGRWRRPMRRAPRALACALLLAAASTGRRPAPAGSVRPGVRRPHHPRDGREATSRSTCPSI